MRMASLALGLLLFLVLLACAPAATPTPQPTPTPTLAPTPTPIPPTPTPEPQLVGVESVDPLILQTCIDQGYVCIPLPFKPDVPVISEYITYYEGPDLYGSGEQVAFGMLGIEIEPDTVVVAPFDAEIQVSNYQEGLPSAYEIALVIDLPDGRVLFLFLLPGDSELLLPPFPYGEGSWTTIRAGEPIFRYLGTPGHEVNSTVLETFSGPFEGYTRRDFPYGLAIRMFYVAPRLIKGLVGGGHPEGTIDFERWVYGMPVELLQNERGELVYILLR